MIVPTSPGILEMTARDLISYVVLKIAAAVSNSPNRLAAHNNREETSYAKGKTQHSSHHVG
jgi:hypothetical protein